MSQHRAKTCGCCMEPVRDDEESDLCSEATGANNGIAWVIIYYPVHGIAPEMKGEVETLTEMHDGRCDFCGCRIAPEGYCGCEPGSLRALFANQG